MRARPAQRLLDLLVASALLVLCLPLMLLAVVIVASGSKGPIIYRSERAGREGHPFTMFKFRTMQTNADQGPRISSVSDRRIVPGGRFLRASKIDELPQLFNIIRGDMSLVGPRPEDPGIVKSHYGPAEWQTLAHRPGLTSPGSLWYYGEGEALLDPADAMKNYATVMQRKLAIDARYAERATILSDLAVMALTGATLLRRIAAKIGIATPRMKRHSRQ